MNTRKRIVGTSIGLGLTIAGAAVVASVGQAAFAANTGSTTASVTVGQTITLSGLSSAFTLTGVPNTTATQNSAVTMNVATNNRNGYNVTVKAAAATMPGTGTNADTIPIAKLQARETGTTTFAPMSTTPMTVHSQTAKSADAGDTVNNDYSVAIPWVNSDTYSATLNYVANAQ